MLTLSACARRNKSTRAHVKTDRSGGLAFIPTRNIGQLAGNEARAIRAREVCYNEYIILIT